MLKASVRSTPAFVAEIMETDGDWDPSLSQSIESIFGGVHIAVIDTKDDATGAPAIDAGSTVVQESIKNLRES